PDERKGPDPHELMDRHESRDDRAVFDRHVSRHLDGVRDDHVVGDVTIVREVHVRHQEAALPHGRLSRRLRPAVDRAVLPDHRGTTDAIISASATIWPSTYPTPFILHVLPRNWTISSSNRI